MDKYDQEHTDREMLVSAARKGLCFAYGWLMENQPTGHEPIGDGQRMRKAGVSEETFRATAETDLFKWLTDQGVTEEVARSAIQDAKAEADRPPDPAPESCGGNDCCDHGHAQEPEEASELLVRLRGSGREWWDIHPKDIDRVIIRADDMTFLRVSANHVVYLARAVEGLLRVENLAVEVKAGRVTPVQAVAMTRQKLDMARIVLDAVTKDAAEALNR